MACQPPAPCLGRSHATSIFTLPAVRQEVTLVSQQFSLHALSSLQLLPVPLLAGSTASAPLLFPVALGPWGKEPFMHLCRKSQEASKPRGLCQAETEKQAPNQAQLLSAPSQAGPFFHTWFPSLSSRPWQHPRMVSRPASPAPAPLRAPGHQAVHPDSPLERNTAHPVPPSNSYTGSSRETKWLKGVGGGKCVLTSANWWMNILYCIYICEWVHQGDKADKQQEWKIFHKIWTAK